MRVVGEGLSLVNGPPRHQQLYVIVAELNFDYPVGSALQDAASLALAALQNPYGLPPKLQWANSRRALATEVGVIAPNKVAAMEEARKLVRDVMARSIGVPLRSIPILSLRVGL